VQKGMSALPPIATAKADFRTRSCLLFPRKRTCAVHAAMSALGQKRTCAPTLAQNVRVAANTSEAMGTNAKIAEARADDFAAVIELEPEEHDTPLRDLHRINSLQR
jgi:hypothetical protein